MLVTKILAQKKVGIVAAEKVDVNARRTGAVEILVMDVVVGQFQSNPPTVAIMGKIQDVALTALTVRSFKMRWRLFTPKF